MGTQRYIFALFCISTVLSCLSNTCWASQWSTEVAVVRPRSFSGDSPRSLALDSGGNPHIVYGDRCLYHAWYDGSTWQHEVVVDEKVKMISISVAIDPADYIHVCYISDDDNKDLYYASNAGGTWQVEVADGGRPGDYLDSKTALAAGSDGKVYITFVNEFVGKMDVIYLTNKTGVWIDEILTGFLGISDIDIALDSMNQPHLSSYCWFLGSRVVHSTFTGGAWQNEIVYSTDITGGFLKHPVIALDSSDQVHIGFLNRDYGELLYMTGTFGSWQSPETIDSGLGTPDPCYARINMNVGTYGDVHFIYFDNDSRDLKYAQGHAGSWAIEIVKNFATPYFGYPSLAVDWTGQVNISYMSDADLTYAVRSTGGWAFDTVDTSIILSGQSPIVVDHKGHTHIIHSNTHGDSSNKLLYTTNASGQWVTEEIDAHGCLDGPRPILVDDNGHIHACYTNGARLYYLTNVSGNWSCGLIYDGHNKNAGYTSIARDSLRNIHVCSCYSYIYVYTCPIGLCCETERFLMYSTNASGLWTTETLDSTEKGRTRLLAAISLDASDKVHLAYSWKYSGYEGSLSKLKYKTNISGSWDTQVFYDSTDDEIYEGCNLVLDSTGHAHFLCYDYYNSIINYWTNKTGAWIKEQDPAGTSTYICLPPALGIDSEDKLYISYCDKTMEEIVLLNGTADSWDKLIIDSCIGGKGNPSLFVDPCDYIYMSYYDETTGNRMYATNNTPVAEIQVSPQALTFFVTGVGTQKKTVNVTSVGGLDLNVSSCTITGLDASQFSRTDSLPEVLATGKSTDIQVTFNPNQTGVYDANLNINSNDPQNPTSTVTLHGISYAEPDYLEIMPPKNWDGFGEVIVGQSSDPAAFTIKNNSSTYTFQLGNIVLVDDTHFSLDLGGAGGCGKIFPRPLAPNATCKVYVTFTPQDVGNFDTLLYTYSVSPFIDEASCLLEGTGVPVPQPQIFVTPPQFDFGKVILGKSSIPLQISIFNNGDYELKVLDIEQTNDDYFTMDLEAGKYPVGITLPVIIQPGDFKTLTVTFNPLIWGTFDNEVNVSSNDPANPEVTITQTGQGYNWNHCDLDVDGDVDFDDFAIMAGQWLSKPSIPSADVAPETLDNFVDMKDLSFCMGYWLAHLE